MVMTMYGTGIIGAASEEVEKRTEAAHTQAQCVAFRNCVLKIATPWKEVQLAPGTRGHTGIVTEQQKHAETVWTFI